MQPYQLYRISVTLNCCISHMTVCNAIWKMQQFKVTDVLILALISIPEVGRLYPPISYSIFHHVRGKSILFSARTSLCRKEAGHTANGRRRHSWRTVCWTSARLSFSYIFSQPPALVDWAILIIYVFLGSILPYLYVAFFLRHAVSYLCLSFVQS